MPKFTETGKELGCSELPSIVETNEGFTGYQDRNSILEKHITVRKGGHYDDLGLNANSKVRAGNYLESPIAKMVQDFLNLYGKVQLIEPTGAERNDLVPGLGSSPDYFIQIDDSINFNDKFGKNHNLTGRGLLEIKNSTIPGLPTNVRIQTQGQMLCGGYSWCIIARFISGWDLQIYVEYANPTVQDLIIESVKDFWERVEEENYFDPSSSSEASRRIKGNGLKETVDLSANNELPGLIAEWKANEKIYKHCKSIKNDLEVHIKSILGPVEYAVCQNYKIKHTTVNYKAQPEKIVPAKEAWSTRKFGIDDINKELHDDI